MGTASEVTKTSYALRPGSASGSLASRSTTACVPHDVGYCLRPAAVEWAVTRGAILANEQPQESVRDLLDPDGHSFCLFAAPNVFPRNSQESTVVPIEGRLLRPFRAWVVAE